ncbi:hypothetical protein LRP30_32885 [Bradyrhizobium sp. C-145]|uniref:hypothetical protein n=1 Tax=Bradyrhizobium TaxID=374 RepID=UPI00100B8EEA|nr:MULTISPECIES: hypothetical protein [Bradyrhizobium]RXG97217.1 hypothetical protein EAV90_22925 [Bradyrhizobium vignae]UQR61584.1 hypothetical protein LRP30_32885 [Bradyrhizobium sp. C-145]
MANKTPSSMPLFGNATPQEVKAIRTEIEAFTDRAARNRDEAQKMLERLGIARAEERPKPKG